MPYSERDAFLVEEASCGAFIWRLSVNLINSAQKRAILFVDSRFLVGGSAEVQFPSQQTALEL